MPDLTKAEIDAKVKTMTEPDMLARRSELVRLSRDIVSRPEGLTTDELTEICSIYGRLRGERGGTPTDATVLKRAIKGVDIVKDLELP